MLSIFFGIAQKETGIDALFLFNMGICLIVFAMSRHLRYGKKVEQDELSKKIAYKSLAASFQFSLFGVLGLWWVDYFYPLAFSVSEALSLVGLSMAIISIVTRFYYAKKIDQI